jgi:hypothetical protein
VRYVNLVYSTAFRCTGSAHHSEEITQAVFIILARKAEKLSPRVVLSVYAPVLSDESGVGFGACGESNGALVALINSAEWRNLAVGMERWHGQNAAGAQSGRVDRLAGLLPAFPG